MVTAMVAVSDGTALRTWTTGTADPTRWPVVLMHGGPGVPDDLGRVAACLDDQWLVHRYHQRGVGGSPWAGRRTEDRYTLEQSVADLIDLLDHWGHDRVTLVGHSFGTNLASYVTLAHPERVAGLVQLAGPFLGPRWRAAEDAAGRARRSTEQQSRMDELSDRDDLTIEEDIELLTLSWFPNHSDPDRAWAWAAESARTCRPVNRVMNAQLNAAKRATPLEDRIDDLRRTIPVHTTIIGGSGDPRPEVELRSVAEQLGAMIEIVPGAGHEPWLEQPDLFRRTFRDAVARQDTGA